MEAHGERKGEPRLRVFCVLRFSQAGEFIRSQGQTQGINITAMLDSGVRFIDFRIMYTGVLGQPNPDKKDWYGLHGCQVREAVAIVPLLPWYQ